MNQLKDLVESQFQTFENQLKSNIQGLEIIGKLCQRRQLQAENSQLEKSLEQLATEVKKWKELKNVMQVRLLAQDRNNNAEHSKSQLPVQFVNDEDTRMILDILAANLDPGNQCIKM